MRILALEPYHGGSHRAFLEGWRRSSHHDWTVLGLPAHAWKWRMRHAPLTLSRQVAERAAAGARWDVILCSDMLDLAAFRGLAPPAVRELPAVAYFHENQLTYPDPRSRERDVHFGFTNLVTALAAEAVWWNSAFHREAFLTAAEELLGRMPDNRHPEAIAEIGAKSQVMSPGVDALEGRRGPREPGPLRILWAARWEHDKNPEGFFEALRLLARRGVPFRVSVIGQQFREAPPVFAKARTELGDRVDRWGWQADRAAYVAALHEADVFVSTAVHEFFGISAVEATSAGAWPLLPRRLAYPELLAPIAEPEAFFHDGEPDGVAERLERLSLRLRAGDDLRACAEPARRAMRRFRWSEVAPALDAGIAACR